ncbi:MAG: MoaD/ThiS family protein [Candidatus Bathyarchaeota archaeon]|nr:MAG: MoaD/ThiS family protein [Candidatus Bathyarchaeota archaeon]
MTKPRERRSTLRVNLRLFASLRELLGNIREEEYEVEEGTTLKDLLLSHVPQRHSNITKNWKEWIFETDGHKVKFDEQGSPVLSYYLILVNGKSINSISEDGKHPGLAYQLKEGDDLAILPPVGGG